MYHFISYFIRNVAASPKWLLACRYSLPPQNFTPSSQLRIEVHSLRTCAAPPPSLPVNWLGEHDSDILGGKESAEVENRIQFHSSSLEAPVKLIDQSILFNFSNYRTNVIGKHEFSVRLVKFNSLENRLISCGDNSLVKVLDIGKIKKCTNLKGHTQSVSAFKFADN